MAKASTDVKKIERDTRRTARKTAANPWTERLERLGYFVRGLVYFIPGVLALQLALGLGGATVDQTSAIRLMASNPLGKILLILIAAGLVGYTLWGLIRALLDPLHRGHDAEGIAERFGFVVSASGYAALLFVTVQYILGATVNSTSSVDWSSKLLSDPIGRVVVAIVGLGMFAGGGVWQFYEGIKADFRQDWNRNKMTDLEKKVGTFFGRIGLPARATVYGLIGLFLVLSAVQADPKQVKGFDGVLSVVAQQPFGRGMLAIIAVGLMGFGLDSMMDARWMRVKVPPQSKRN